MQLSRNYRVVAAVNDDAILAANLAQSPDLALTGPVLEMRGCRSAAEAYNRGLDASDGDVTIFAHQDVYLPAGWLARLDKALVALDVSHPHWGVIGVYGVTPTGQHVGECWSTGLGRLLGGRLDEPVAVGALDELVIILRRDPRLRFDPALPGFHLYGTDIVQTALTAGFGAYVLHLPVVHNSRPVKTLAGAYTAAYRFMARKWVARLPIATTVVPLTRFGYPLYRHRLRAYLRKRAPRALERESGPQIARRLGFE